MFKVNNKDARTTSMFHIISVVDFEQVNVCCLNDYYIRILLRDFFVKCFVN